MRLEHVRRGSGEPLVLLHGLGDSWRAWSAVLPLLERERDCWALDLPGFGGSPPLTARDPSPEALAVAVAEFMAARGVERFHVAGNSLGGAVALELGRIGVAASVCAVCPSGFTEGWERRFLGASLAGTRRLAELLVPRLERVPLQAGPVRRLLLVQLVHRGERVAPDDLSTALRLLAGAPGFRATLKELRAYRFEGPLACSATIAWGEHDRLNLFRPQSARARRRLPAARHVTLAGCGHLPGWDDPARLAAAILSASASTGRAGA